MSGHGCPERTDSRERFLETLLEVMPTLKRRAIAYCGLGADADDLVQAACERALVSWQQWRGRVPLEHWVIRILTNLRLDQLRRQATRRSVRFDALPEPASPDGDLEERGYLDEVERAVAGLPPDQRDVLVLVAARGHTYREASACLGVPVGTVMSRLHRARQALVGMLDAGAPLNAPGAASRRRSAATPGTRPAAARPSGSAESP